MYQIQSNTVNGLCLSAFNLLKEHGDTTVSDKGTVIEVRRVMSELTDPAQRYLYLHGRNSSIYAAIAETMWVMSGSSTISGWLTKFLHRAPLYSDDGHTWYRAYGKMLYQNNQLAGVFKYLKDSVASRQAVLSIYDPAAESYDSVKNALGTPNAKDKSCNNLLYFSSDFTRTKLDLHVSNRSNDVLFGAYSINLFEFTFLQEIVATVLGLKLGIYSVSHNNFHAYLDTQANGKQFYDVLDSDQEFELEYNSSGNVMDLGIALDKSDMDKTATSIRALFTDLIKSLESGKDEVLMTLVAYNIKPKSKLHNYALLLNSYLYETPLSIDHMDISLQRAIKASKFTKFQFL